MDISLSRIPLKTFFTFRTVAQLKSFKKAAEQLCVTSQAISLQMRNLEESLGFKLFERYPAGVALTEAGLCLFDYVERSFHLLEQGIQAAHTVQKRRQFRINASPWFAVHRLLPMIEQFEKLHPDVDVRITTSVRYPDFISQRLDCAVQWGWGQWPSSAKQRLLKDDKCLVCAPSLITEDKPLARVEDLHLHRFLCTELSVELWEMLSNTLGADLLVEKQALVLDSQASQVEATIKGLGVALISQHVALEAVQDGRLTMPLWSKPVSHLNPALLPGYWLVLGEERQEDHLTLSFQEWLSASLQDDPRYCGV
jgi:LysR family glycine cleavage system transcriptional activator